MYSDTIEIFTEMILELKDTWMIELSKMVTYYDILIEIYIKPYYILN